VESWLMKSKMKTRVPVLISLLTLVLTTPVLVNAQAVAARFLGTVTAVSGNELTVKTDAGEVHQVDVPSSASLKQIEPGAKDLSTAQTIEFGSLATGDRVLVKLDPNAPAGTTTALQVVAVKQAALAKKQEEDRQQWQQHGVGGIVKSVDTGSGDIVITNGAGSTAKTTIIHTTKTSVLKRYAPASVRFDEAKVAPIDTIHAGDQLRARGTKNAAGTEITADETISGTFRNLSGLVPTVDAAGSTLVVKDLATKKQITIHISPETQMRRLDEQMATRFAAMLNGNGSTFAARSGGGNGGARPQGGSGGGQGGATGGPGGGQRAGFGGGGFDAQMLFSRAPLIKLADVKKGDAVMVVATEDGSGVTAITLLAGVEPLLEAPAASQNLLNWSLSSGAPDVAQ
jgi:hypothetical protein